MSDFFTVGHASLSEVDLNTKSAVITKLVWRRRCYQTARPAQFFELTGRRVRHF